MPLNSHQAIRTDDSVFLFKQSLCHLLFFFSPTPILHRERPGLGRFVQGLTLPVPMDQLREHVSAEIEAELRPLLDRAPTSGRSLNIWYAAALAHLDKKISELA